MKREFLVEHIDEAVRQKFSRSYLVHSSGCWLWTGPRDEQYGAFFWRRMRVKAHRLSVMLRSGEDVPHGMMVCHSCDVPLCVNPAHLWVGSASDNYRDCVQKRRSVHFVMPDRIQHGSEHAHAKLTEQDIPVIRALHRQGEGTRKIASRFGVDRTTVRSVLSGETWKHVA